MKKYGIGVLTLLLAFSAFSAEFSGGEGGSGGGPRAMADLEEAWRSEIEKSGLKEFQVEYFVKEPGKIESILFDDGQEVTHFSNREILGGFRNVELVIFKDGDNYTRSEILEKFMDHQKGGKLNLNGLVLEAFRRLHTNQPSAIFPKSEINSTLNPSLGDPGIGGFQGLP